MMTHYASRFNRLVQVSLWAALLSLPGVDCRLARAATVYLNSNRTIQGTIDESASDDRQVVIITGGAAIKIPRSKVLRIEQGGPAADNAAPAAVSADAQKQERLNYDAYFQKIEALIAGNRFEEAVKEADGAIARINDERARLQARQLKAQAHIGLARVCQNNINYPEEEANYKQAMEADPENPMAPLELAKLLQSSAARKAEAIGLYETGIACAARHSNLIKPEDLLNYQFTLADLYLGEKRYRESGDMFLHVMLADKAMQHSQADDMAITAYSRIMPADMDAALRDHIIANASTILKQKPRKQGAYLLLGHIYFNQKLWASARENLQQAVENSETNDSGVQLQETLFQLGVCQRKLRANSDAINTFERLLSLKSDHYDGLCELADILVEESNLPEARRLYESAMKNEPDKYRAHLGKGITLQRDGNYEEARKSFKAVLDRDKKNAQAQLAIARSYFEEKKFDETIAECEKVLALVRDRYQDKKTKGAAAKDNPSTATATVAASPVDPNTTSTASSNAEGPKVVDDTVLLTRISPEDRQIMAEVNTLIGKSNMLNQPPKTNLARDYFALSLKFEPRYAIAYEGLGTSFAADHLEAQAEENFQKAIAIDPKNPDFYRSFAVYWQDRKVFDKALKLYQQYQELGGKDPSVETRIKECSNTKPRS